MSTPPIRYKRHCLPPEIVAHAVWLFGSIVTHAVETVQPGIPEIKGLASPKMRGSLSLNVAICV